MSSSGLCVSPVSSHFFHHAGFVCCGKIAKQLIQNARKSVGGFEQALMAFGLIKQELMID